MALGGGIWTTQNKKLPGTYINFVSAARATAVLSERGFAAMPLELDWGADGEVVTVEVADFIRDCQRIFGYHYTHDKMKGLRDLFLNAKTLYFYRLNSGVKADNTYATAKYSGVRGNDIKIVITANVDDPDKFDVATYLDTNLVDKQISIASMAELVDNDYVVFKKDADIALTAATPLTNGSNAADVTGQNWQDALTALEPYSFNTLGAVTTTDTIKALVIEYAKRMRDDVGVKFQAVVYNKEADTEAAISVANKVKDADANEASLVYWVTGAEAGCKVNKSCTNKNYDGYFEVDTNHSQAQLEAFIDKGQLALHKVGDEVHVLTDVNTLTTVTLDKNEDFQSNQTIRVLDQIANDTATIFNTKFLGLYPNSRSGRIGLWNELVKLHTELQDIQAIEDFEPEDVTVEQGTLKNAVVVNDVVTPVNAMEKLYMSVTVA